MERASSKDIPENAVVLTREEALAHVYDLVLKHKPVSDVLLLKYGSFVNGLLSVVAGVGALRFYRKAFGLRKELEISSSLTCAIIPGTSIYIYQHMLVYPNILLQEYECPVCLQLRSAAIQFVGGVCIPVLTGLVTASMTAMKLGSNMPKPSEPLKLLKLGLKLAYHPTARYKLLGMTVISIFGTMFLVEGQQMQVITLKKRLTARREMIED